MEIPRVVRNVARNAGAEGWLAGLPGLVTRLSDEWGLTPGPAYEDATEAYVAPVTLGDGTEAVLKVLVRHAEQELTVLRLAAGHGCVRLLRHDPDSGAMLLERLGPSMYRVGLPVGRRHEVLVDVARALWRPAPGAGLPTGADRARRLAAYVEEFADVAPQRAVDQALAAAASRAAAHDDRRAVLCHGDVHQWNTLRAGDGWKLVDPDGWLGEPELDLGVLMREDPAELLTGDPRERSRWLAARTGLDETAIWEWGLIDRMQNGISCVRDGLEPHGTLTLRAAARIASA